VDYYLIIVFFLFHFLLFLAGSILGYSAFFEKEHHSGGTGNIGAFFGLLTIAVIISLILSGVLTIWAF